MSAAIWAPPAGEVGFADPHDLWVGQVDRLRIDLGLALHVAIARMLDDQLERVDQLLADHLIARLWLDMFDAPQVEADRCDAQLALLERVRRDLLTRYSTLHHPSNH